MTLKRIRYNTLASKKSGTTGFPLLICRWMNVDTPNFDGMYTKQVCID